MTCPGSVISICSQWCRTRRWPACRSPSRAPPTIWRTPPSDAEALRSDLSYLYTTPNGQYQYLRCDYDIREYGRLSLNANAAVFILGALYTAVVFVCMVMAILALKTLSGLAEDRRRYTVLMRLGADRRTRCRALLRQTFSFFLLPFALPLLLSIPTAIVCADIMNLSGYADLAGQVPICAWPWRR